MSEICTTCGLPKELCVCESIAKESQKIAVFAVQRKFKKVYTVIQGIDPKAIDIEDMAKKLKGKLACGGTVKEGNIELQGDHRARVKRILVELGFSQESIEVR